MAGILGAEKGFQVDGLTAALQMRNQVLSYNQLSARYNRLSAQYDELEQMYDTEVKNRKLQQADAQARLGQFLHLAAEVPNAPCLKPTQQKYKDGTNKTIARLVYEQAFRAEAKKRGLLEQDFEPYLKA